MTAVPGTVAPGRIRRRARAAVLAPMVLGLLVLPASGADAAGLTLNPAVALRSALTEFTADGTTSPGAVLNVLFNGVLAGRTNADRSAGNYAGTFSVPSPGKKGVPVCGNNPVGIINARTGAQVDTGTILALCPSITVTPRLTAARPGQPRTTTYRVASTDFLPTLATQLSVDSTPRPFTAADPPAPPDPSHPVDLPDIEFTAALPCGTHRVTLAQTQRVVGVSRGPTPQASTDMFVMCSSITLTPDSVRQPGEPTAVVVDGVNFHPNAQVEVRLDGGPAQGASTNAGGVFRARLPVTGVPCGAHQVSAVETSRFSTSSGSVSFSASATLAVTDCPVSAATLGLDPAVIQVGMLTHVTGAGFTPGTPVTLGWVGPDNTPLPGDCTAGADAAGRLDTYCLVLPHGILGMRQLVAAQGTLTATADAVVDGGTMQPSSTDAELVFRR